MASRPVHQARLKTEPPEAHGGGDTGPTDGVKTSVKVNHYLGGH
jgi:hypothetical protein